MPQLLTSAQNKLLYY